jgi:hypothetical protein
VVTAEEPFAGGFAALADGRGAREVLAPYTAADGTLAAPFEVHVVAARR